MKKKNKKTKTKFLKMIFYCSFQTCSENRKTFMLHYKAKNFSLSWLGVLCEYISVLKTRNNKLWTWKKFLDILKEFEFSLLLLCSVIIRIISLTHLYNYSIWQKSENWMLKIILELGYQIKEKKILRFPFFFSAFLRFFSFENYEFDTTKVYLSTVPPTRRV